MLGRERLAPLIGVHRKNSQPDGYEMLLQVEHSDRYGPTHLLEYDPDTEAVGRINKDSSDDCSDYVYDDDSVRVRGPGNRAKPRNERAGPRAHRCQHAQRLVCDRSQQRDGKQGVNNEKCRDHKPPPRLPRALPYRIAHSRMPTG